MASSSGSQSACASKHAAEIYFNSKSASFSDLSNFKGGVEENYVSLKFPQLKLLLERIRLCDGEDFVVLLKQLQPGKAWTAAKERYWFDGAGQPIRGVLAKLVANAFQGEPSAAKRRRIAAVMKALAESKGKVKGAEKSFLVPNAIDTETLEMSKALAEVARQSPIDEGRCNDLLTRLEDVKVTFTVLKVTGLGLAVNAIRKSPSISASLAAKAKRLRAQWKDQVQGEPESKAAEPAASAGGATALMESMKSQVAIGEESKKALYKCLVEKYKQPKFRAILLSTGDAILHERPMRGKGNAWTFPGGDQLGKMLCKLRREIREEE